MLRDPDGQAIVNPTTAPEPDVPDNPDAIHGARGHDGRWFAVPSREEANEAFVTEAPADGSIYGRNGQTGQWELTAAAGLQITSIIPDKSFYGNGIPLLTVHAYGDKFTDTCVIVIDGQDSTSTAYVSETELTFVLNPQVPINEQFHIVTVRDPAVPEVGLGAEQFDFIKATSEVDYGRGLSLDTVPTPPIVNLDPAGPTNLGGVIVPVRDGSTNGLVIDMGNEALGDPATGHLTAPPATAELLGTVKVTARNKHSQGLNLDANGFLFAPPATHEHLGAIVEPPPDGLTYARTNPTDGPGEWVEVQPGGMEEPPADPVALWGRTSAGARGWEEVPTFNHLSGFVEKHGDTMTGPLTLPGDPQYPKHAVTKDWAERTFVGEAPADGQLYVRSDENWAALPNIAGAELLDPKVSKHGDSMSGPLTLSGPPTQPRHAATKDYVDLSEPQEAPFNGKTHGRKDGQWIEIEPGHGGGIEEPPASPVAIWARSSAGARGWIAVDQTGVVVAGDNPGQKGIVYIPDRGGISLYQDGRIELSPTTPSQIGGIVDAPFSADPNDPTSYVRQDGAWVVSAAGDKVYIAGDTPDRTGVVYVPDGRGITLQVDGAIGLAPPTPTQIGGFIDAPWDGKSYARKDAAWVEAVGSEFTTVGRSPTQALEEGYDTTLDKRVLWVPLATDFLAGAIVEPPVDGKQYSRVNDVMAGAPAWVENTAKGVAVGDVPPTGPSPGDLWFESDSGSLFVFYEDDDSAQWVETGSGSETKATIEIGDAPPPNPTIGQFWWNSVTGQTFIFYDDSTSAQWVQTSPGPEGGGTAGGITEAPLDGLQYGRQSGVWTEVVTSVTIVSDTPPVNPDIGDLWFQGTTLDTFIWASDGTSTQWIQQNTPFDPTGLATELYVQDYVANAIIDAAGFTRAATEAVGHNTDACEKALAAVEKLSGAVTQLQAGHHALKKRIAALEKRLH